MAVCSVSNAQDLYLVETQEEARCNVEFRAVYHRLTPIEKRKEEVPQFRLKSRLPPFSPFSPPFLPSLPWPTTCALDLILGSTGG